MAKKITIGLSQSSINQAVKDIQAYKERLLRKLELFTTMLENDGIEIAKAWVGASMGDSTDAYVYGTQVDRSGNICRAKIMMTGKDVLFIEFGAGIYYNSSDPPHAGEFGYGVGTYPNQTHALEDSWWYEDEFGQSKMSRGTQATYPMYHAAENIRNEAIKKALEVFRS